MRRFVVPGIPFLVSFALSLSTAGSHVYWQDSGFFLVAVKELGVLYPPGFVLYVLLCKAWTLALWWVDFTYAVHLFSATCAALAAGTLAVAVRDLLRTKGPLFHTVQEEGPLAEWVGVCIGCLAASGYTFWAAAILAKVYAFYYLILTLLIWRMIRADESGKPRDFTGVAVLIGLAWQAHPSATNAGLALILFAAFHRRVVGWKGLAWRSGLAALCALGPVHLLPLMARSGSVLKFGDPSTIDGFFSYVLGTRFTSHSDYFGWERSRLASVGRYAWEEFLGIGLLLIAAGFWRLWQNNRRLLAGVLTWTLPVLAITVYFRLEGQHDFWMVAAWIPLWLVAAVGLTMVGKGREIAVVLALIGTIWSVVANRKDLDQRNYTLAETFGHLYLDHVAQESGIKVSSDDVQSTTLYLQRIRGVRPDVGLVSHILETGRPGPRPKVRYEERIHVSDLSDIPKGSRVPTGPMTRGELLPGETLDPSIWDEPIPAEELPKYYRRARGQAIRREGDHDRFAPEPYEARLQRVLLRARRLHALALSRDGKLAQAALIYESIFRIQPLLQDDASMVYATAVVYVGLARYAEAEAAFKKVLTLEDSKEYQPQIYYFLTGLCGDRAEAAQWKAKALMDPDLPPELRAKLRER